MLRTIFYNQTQINYYFEQKQIKNINLRIKKDCSVHVSAPEFVPISKIDDFVIDKAEYIISAKNKFEQMNKNRPSSKRYISGESFYILGRGLRLKVEKSDKNEVFSDGVYIFLKIKNTDDFNKKQRMIKKYIDTLTINVFNEITLELYPIFNKYGVDMPIIRMRDMKTRWGSCIVNKNTITLNKKLIETPRSLIEYVVMHEFCHFIHPNHSKQFYNFLSILMPDWKQRKKALDKYAEFLE